MTLPEGVLIYNRYEIISVIGIGGFGITYKGYDIFNESVCAVKELFVNNYVTRAIDGINIMVNTGKEETFQHAIERFMDEAETLKKLNGTPNVVKITDYFKENNTAYFVMDYIDGLTLKGEMQVRGGKFEYEDALYIIKTIGRNLSYIHREHHIFHRDISPENIMLDTNKEPMLIDFGNAKSFMRNSAGDLSVILKIGFAPLEQYTGKNQGPWTDVYSLACVFYYIVSGSKVPPSTERLTGESYPPLYHICPSCSRTVSDAIDKALKLDYKVRMQSVKELSDVLEQEAETLSGSNFCKSHKKLEVSVKFPYVNVFEFGYKSGKWRVPIGRQVIIGRDRKCSDIIVGEYDNTISKQHCIIEFDNMSGKFIVRDTSTNGTYQKGKRLDKYKRYTVDVGEKIKFGNGKYIIETGVE